MAWNTDVYSLGTARVADWSGGGKTPVEAVEDLRHRFASGTFRRLVLPTVEARAALMGPTAPGELRVACTEGQGGTGVVLRHKRVALGPNEDIALRLDDGTVAYE